MRSTPAWIKTCRAGSSASASSVICILVIAAEGASLPGGDVRPGVDGAVDGAVEGAVDGAVEGRKLCIGIKALCSWLGTTPKLRDVDVSLSSCHHAAHQERTEGRGRRLWCVQSASER